MARIPGFHPGYPGSIPGPGIKILLHATTHCCLSEIEPSFLSFEMFLISGHLPYNNSLNKITLIVLGILSFTLNKHQQGLAGGGQMVTGSPGSLGSTPRGANLSRCDLR